MWGFFLCDQSIFYIQRYVFVLTMCCFYSQANKTSKFIGVLRLQNSILHSHHRNFSWNPGTIVTIKGICKNNCSGQFSNDSSLYVALEKQCTEMMLHFGVRVSGYNIAAVCHIISQDWNIPATDHIISSVWVYYDCRLYITWHWNILEIPDWRH